MKCPKCGNEVDTSLCAACPVCRTPINSAGYQMQGIGMQDSFGNTITTNGNFASPKRKLSRGQIFLIIFIVTSIIVGGAWLYFSKNETTEHSYADSIILARENARKVIEQELKYKNLNTWYANTYIEDDGNNKFIIYCDVYGELTSGEYARIQKYVGIELKDNGAYNYWKTVNVYPNGDSTPNTYEPAYAYVLQLKNSMQW